jgi:hypothetical protein
MMMVGSFPVTAFGEKMFAAIRVPSLPDRGVPYTDVVGERKHSMLRGRRRLLRGCQSQDRSKDRKQGNEGAKNLSAAPRGFRDGAVSHGYRPT